MHFVATNFIVVDSSTGTFYIINYLELKKKFRWYSLVLK
jgi:hypothetical protein